MNTSDDRILVLDLIDPTTGPLNTIGMTDKRLFNGGNKLHGIKDPQTCLWYFKLDHGVLPPSMKQLFTSFKVLLKFAEDYYKQRNIKVKETIY